LAQYGARHVKLAERLHQTKIPHMCSHQHHPEQAKPLCAQLNTQGAALLDQFKRNRIVPPPETRMEQLARLHAEDPYGLMEKLLLHPEQLPGTLRPAASTLYNQPSAK
jgi:hypothetical protein